MFSLDLKKKGWLYTYNLLINNLLHLHLHLLIDNAFASSQYRLKKKIIIIIKTCKIMYSNILEFQMIKLFLDK